MKVLLLYTSYRQKEEFDLGARFLNRTERMKTFDVLVYCNNIELDIESNFDKLPNPNKKLIQKDKNKGGYALGQLEVLADCYQDWKDYDYVIHLHPDIFVTCEEKVLKYLDENFENDVVFIVNHPNRDMNTFGTDFFIMKPKLLPYNIFNLWSDPILAETKVPELVFRKILDHIGIKYIEIPRFHNNRYYPRRIDLNGLWHEHDLQKVKKYLQMHKIY